MDVLRTGPAAFAAGVELRFHYCERCDNAAMLGHWGFAFEDNPNALEDPGAVNCAAHVTERDGALHATSSLRESAEQALQLGSGEGEVWDDNLLNTLPPCRSSVLEARETQGPLRCSLARLAWEYCARHWRQDDLERLAGLRPNTIFGQAYVQSGVLGYASYHFHGQSDAYISYESDRSESFLLDDGSRPPPRKYFDEAFYQPAVRTFRGAVTWAPSTWFGSDRWEFEMVFSEDLSRIASGHVWLLGAGEGTIGPRIAIVAGRFGVDLPFRGRWVGPVDTPFSA